MIQALAPTRLRIRSESLDIKEGEQSITLFRDVLRAAQDRLKEFGYYTGTPDGAFGPATRAALQAFQRERKLAETGLPDQATLYELFR
ncbi:MAG: peptidoglycan-binding protein [Alphaproteobacteria bacterium]|nr:peptidoglycan-binding protein [Alphaproteobacteria bacterium]